MESRGIYIYGIVPNFYGAVHFRSLENAGVFAIPFQNISAIVSVRDFESLQSSNLESNPMILEHHKDIIEQVMSLGFKMILPMKPGTIVKNRPEVLTILTKGQDLFISSFNQIENMIEIDLTVTWNDFDGLLKDLSTHPEIVELRDSMIKKNGSFSRSDFVKTEILLWEKLSEINKQIEIRILNVLTSMSTNLKIHEIMNDKVISNAAFLIKRNLLDKFRQTVDQFNKDYDCTLTFKLTGPLPCYSFYTIEVKEMSIEKIACARKELGLNEEPLEPMVKRAYLNYASMLNHDVRHENGDEERFKRIQLAYNTLLEYSMAVKQSSDIEPVSLNDEKTIRNMILVKVKD